MMSRGILYTLTIGVCLSLTLGCGGGGSEAVEDKLTGQWVAEKLNARGDRLVLDLAGEGTPRRATITALPLSGDSYTVSSGNYQKEQAKIVFTLSGLGKLSSPFTVSEKRLILGTEAYDRVTGPLEGPQVGGQVKISEEAGNRTIKTKSEAEFVPGEVLVKYKNGTFGKIDIKPDESKLPALTMSDASEAGDLTSLSFQLIEQEGQVQGQLIEATLKMVRELNGGNPSALSISVNPAREIEWAAPNALLRLQSADDPLFSDQWNLGVLDITDAWTQITPPHPDKQVVVAVIDSGIVRGHPDLDDRILLSQGYDFTSHKAYDSEAKKTIDDLDLDGQPGPDKDPTDPGDGRKMGFKGSDSSWHGSHLTGIIAANPYNKTGMAGLTFGNVKVLPIRAMGYKGIGTLYDVAQAISYAAHLPNIADCEYEKSEKESITSYTVKNSTCKFPDPKVAGSRPRADVINLSLAGDISVEMARPLIDAIDGATKKKNVLIVAASGNEHRRVTDERPVYPASDPRVIAVGSVCPNLSFAASYSNFGKNQFLVAPGGCGSSDILGTIEPNVQGGYGALHGTSQAAAHVSAVAALVISEMKSRSLAFSPADVSKILKETATDLGETGWDEYYGYGLLSACSAIVKAKGGSASGAAALRLSSESVDLGALGGSHTVVVTGGCGGAPLSGISASKKTDDGGNWLEVTTSGTEAPARAAIKVDRSRLAQGTYSGSVVIQSNGGSKTVQVKMAVGPKSPLSEDDKLLGEIEKYLAGKETSESEGFFSNKIDVGEVRIELVDPATREPKGYLTTDFRSNYHFQFVRVPPGKYGVQAGIDENRDGKICQKEEDEPCLVYGTKSELTVIEVTPSLKKNDLVLNY